MFNELESLRAANTITERIGVNLDLDSVLKELPRLVIELTQCQRVVLYVAEVDGMSLRPRAFATKDGATHEFSEHDELSLAHRSDDPVVAAWRSKELFAVSGDTPTETILKPVSQWFSYHMLTSVPLHIGDRLIGLLTADNMADPQPLSVRVIGLLKALATPIAIALHNADLHTRTVKELASNMYSLNVFRRVDREINEQIHFDHVSEITLDWAIRYTNANAGSLALYDEASDSLRFVKEIGYEATPEQLDLLRSTYGGGITHRVARSGEAEIIPDVSLDSAYVTIAPNIRSHLSVPVTREDRVVAVISVESRKLNGITEDHQTFVEQLASRAGAAIENARLFAETTREREKLAVILRSIADVVVVISNDGKLVLVNDSAIGAFRLYPHETYTGQDFEEVFADTEFYRAFNEVRDQHQLTVREIQLPNGRTYSAHFAQRDDIGWIVVLHDITPLKETDQLKNELIDTVSHDLKQPLSIMSGYMELIQMTTSLDERANGFITVVLRSIQNMRNLIDDLLDMAKIEGGLQLALKPVDLAEVVRHVTETNLPSAQSKQQTLTFVEPTEALPLVQGDRARLEQVFANLIGNAIKYSPPEGSISVSFQSYENAVMVAIKDTGLGISPEDQARIFDRFYRVRRAETENIEGTGVGLAIVKRLVEMHHGHIGLESALGKGSTFFVSLPIT